MAASSISVFLRFRIPLDFCNFPFFLFFEAIFVRLRGFLNVTTNKTGLNLPGCREFELLATFQKCTAIQHTSITGLVHFFIKLTFGKRSTSVVVKARLINTIEAK